MGQEILGPHGHAPTPAIPTEGTHVLTVLILVSLNSLPDKPTPGSILNISTQQSLMLSPEIPANSQGLTLLTLGPSFRIFLFHFQHC